MNITILFGGESYEHEISIVSAITLIKKMQHKINIEFCVFLSPQHDFYLIDLSNMNSKYFSSEGYKKATKIEIGKGGFYKTNVLGKKKWIANNVVLNLIHGKDGEDGVLCGLFEFYGIDFIGPRVDACVLSYDKHITKIYAKELNIKTLPYVVYYRGDSIKLPFEYPVIVKPSRLGSSIGVNVVDNDSELEYALDSALEFDTKVIIEPFMKGVKEYNLAGAKIDSNEFIFSIIEEPQKKDLLNFDDKYLDFSRTQEVLSADVTESLKTNLCNAFKKIYGDIFNGALIRCDFFIIDDDIYINEINPIPGSMANYLFANFEDTLFAIAKSIPKKSHIKLNYNYIHKIQKAKGK